MMPDIIIDKNIEKIIKKLSKEDYELVKKYIEDLIESNYIYWEEAMGDDL